MMTAIPPLYPGVDLEFELALGFPSVHEAYRAFRDQKDMVCGPYTLTYILQAFGINTHNGKPVTVDRTASIAGAALEPHNEQRRQQAEEKIEQDELPVERAEIWSPHEYFTHPLAVTDEGGTSPEGMVKACTTLSGGHISAIPIPATINGHIQFTADRFTDLLTKVLDGNMTGQVIFNYNLKHILAPVSLLGHKYNPTALLTQWDDPDYFRRFDWDVGHFTTLTGRISREDSDRRYVVIRDSYRTFGWNGYHLQPESYIREGLVRKEDDRDGGLFLIIPSDDEEDVDNILDEIGLETELWDNGSPYIPVEKSDDGE